VVGPDGTWVPDAAGPITLVNSTGNVVRTDGYGVDRGWLADADRHHPEPDVFGFCGAAAILRTSALRDVGLFDEDFFLYYEDSDLSWRLRLGGYRVEYCPDAVVRHVHAASTGEGSELFRFHDGRNRLLMLTKDATAARAVLAVGRYVLTTSSIAARRSQPWPHVRVRLRVLASYARLLPRMLARRRAITRAARCDRRDVERLLAPVPATATGGYRG
jgi:GT2 family glycosyltransferase